MQGVCLAKTHARELKQHALNVYFAARDSRTPWPVRPLVVIVAAYAFSPIDLIPDFVPILGYLDDVILVPLGLALVVRLTPANVLADTRIRAQQAAARSVSYAAAAISVALWLLAFLLAAGWIYKGLT